MSTRAILARPTDTGWEGVYIHGDGYPSFTGLALHNQVRAHYAGDITRAWRDLIYAHRTGYSYLDERQPGRNECYCHKRGEGVDPAHKLLTTRHAREMDFSYVLHPESLAIYRWDYGLVCRVPWDYEDTPWDDIEDAAYRMRPPTVPPGPDNTRTTTPRLTLKNARPLETGLHALPEPNTTKENPS